MTEQTTPPQFREDDIRLLMTLALVGGRRMVAEDFIPIFEAWRMAYPNDALGPLCIGLERYTSGDHADGLALLATAAQAETRSEQAREILADFDPSHPLAHAEEEPRMSATG